MPHSVIIGDTRGVPSLSHVRPAAFLSKDEGWWEGVIRFGMCAKLCARIRAVASYSEARSRVLATCLCADTEISCVYQGIYQDTRPAEKDIIGEERRARDSNLQGCAQSSVR